MRNTLLASVASHPFAPLDKLNLFALKQIFFVCIYPMSQYFRTAILLQILKFQIIVSRLIWKTFIHINYIKFRIKHSDEKDLYIASCTQKHEVGFFLLLLLFEKRLHSFYK